MSRVKFVLSDAGRIQKKYPLVRHISAPRYTADKFVEIETLILDFSNESEKQAVFEATFADIPAVSVTLLTESGQVGSVNVYAYDVSKTGVTVRASSDITAKVTVQAIYIAQ